MMMDVRSVKDEVLSKELRQENMNRGYNLSTTAKQLAMVGPWACVNRGYNSVLQQNSFQWQAYGHVLQKEDNDCVTKYMEHEAQGS